jgi:hypothetical protein
MATRAPKHLLYVRISDMKVWSNKLELREHDSLSQKIIRVIYNCHNDVDKESAYHPVLVDLGHIRTITLSRRF